MKISKEMRKELHQSTFGELGRMFHYFFRQNIFLIKIVFWIVAIGFPIHFILDLPKDWPDLVLFPFCWIGAIVNLYLMYKRKF